LRWKGGAAEKTQESASADAVNSHSAAEEKILSHMVPRLKLLWRLHWADKPSANG
jgi:hypothetical protein